MTQKSSTYRSERDAEPNERLETAQAANDPTLRDGIFWANAFRSISLEGSSSEERLRARANLVSRDEEPLAENDSVVPAPTPQYELVAPGVIPLPDFDGTVSATFRPSGLASESDVNVSLRSEELEEIEAFEERQEIDETSSEQDLDSLETSPLEFQDDESETTVSFSDLKRRPGFYTALVETLFCFPCGLLALFFLWRAAVATEREDYGAAARYDAKTQTTLYVGKVLFVLAFFSASTALIAYLLNG